MFEPDLVQTFPAVQLRAIRLALTSASVTLEATDRKDVRVLAHGIRQHPQLMPSLSIDGDTLIAADASECLLPAQDRIALTVQIPRNLKVTVHLLAGSVQLNGSFEEVSLKVRFGSISGCAPARLLKIRVFAGDVRLGGLTGAADVQLSLGDLTMAWSHLDGGESIRARTFVGETVLDLPDHMTLLDGHAVDLTTAVARPTTRTTETLEILRATL